MPETAINADEPTATDKLTPNDFLESLRELGRALPVNFQPTSHDGAAIVAGLAFYLATGSLEAPRVETPDESAVRVELAEQTRENELTARIAELERQAKARDAGPSPFAPSPVADVPTLESPKSSVPSAPVPVEPTPVEPTPVEPTPVEPTPVEPAPVEPSGPVPIDPLTASPAQPVEGEGDGQA